MYTASTFARAAGQVLRFSQSNDGVAERDPIRTGTLRAVSYSTMRRPVLPVPPSTKVVCAVIVALQKFG